MKKSLYKYIGRDYWDRAIIKSVDTGQYLCDINLTKIYKKSDLKECEWCTYSNNDYIDGEPCYPIKNDNIDIINYKLMYDNPQEFEYMLLDRLKSDCDYFLGNGGGNTKDLWAGNIERQIKKMGELYSQLKIKPEWITLEDIEKYRIEMLNYK